MKRLLLVIAVMALSAWPSHAQTQKRDVDLKAADGTLLKGTYFSPGKPGPGVLLLPMCNSQRQAWDNVGDMLAARGLHVITMDYRGFGESGPKREANMSQQERQQARQSWPDDIFEALKYLKAQPGVNREWIGAGGGSCGVENALQLAQRRSEVKTLVLLSGPASPASQEYVAESAWLPVFASAARDDGNIVDQMKWLVGFSSNAASVMKEYPAGGHGTDMFRVHNDLEPAIAGWFEQHLVKSPVKASTVMGPGGPSAQFAERLRQPGGAAQMLDALRQARAAGRAYDLPGASAINALGVQTMQTGRPQEAVPIFSLSIEAYPTAFGGHIGMAQTKFAQRDYESAAASYARAIELGDPGFVVHNDLASMQLYMGRKEEALKNYQRAVEIATRQGQGGFGHFLLARAYARMGEKDKAFEALEKAASLGFTDRGRYEADAHLASVRSDPRFQQFLAKLSQP